MRRSITFLRVLIVLLMQGVLVRVYAQETPEIPSIACPDNFEYLRYGHEYIARITVPNVGHGMTQLDVQLTQREPVPSNYYGHLSLFQDKEVTLNNINDGRPVSYRLDFPISSVLPKLLRISLNGDVICAAPSRSLGVVFNLQHKLQTPLQPFSAVSTQVKDLAPVVFKGQITSTPMPTRRIKSTAASNPLQRESVEKIIERVFGFECGVSSAKQRTDSTDNLAVRGEHPWLVAIYKKDILGLIFQCVGSLVSPRSVITSASCFNSEKVYVSQFVVYLGRYDLNDYDESGVVVRNIAKLSIHPFFNSKTSSDADLAIVLMAKPVRFTDYIRNICLWDESVGRSLIIGQTGFVVGWHTNEDYSSVTDWPKIETEVIASEEKCLNSSSYTICAQNRYDYGPCLNDTGGGLMFNRKGVWKLRGVVSASQLGNGRCLQHEYILYCDIAKHLPWIRDNLI